MRYWYDSGNFLWTSNDGYKIWLDSNIYAYKLYNHNGFCIRVWFCNDLLEQLGDLDIKLHTYMFYKAERFITLSDGYYHLDQLPDPDCTVKFKDDHTCGNCRRLIFKRYDERRGFCRILRIHRYFEDSCKYEEEMS